MTKLVVVESPAKSKTINKYLGKDYKVLASMGHIRDLPSKTGSVDVDNDFHMKYEMNPRSTKTVSDLSSEMKKADELILATDPDREGEAIAWHVAEVLKGKKVLGDKPIRRVVFNAITKKAVTDAMANPREVDMDLVNAQQARRALDYLVGFTLSPVLWKKLPGSKSAGRVQSVALRLICEREKEIETFIPQEYWDIKVDLETKERQKLIATLTHIDGEKLDKFDINDEKKARDVQQHLQSKDYEVVGIEKKQSHRKPYAPFTTSTMQQEASRKLGFSAKKTMMVAQKLYEGVETDTGTHGLITYMRTDGIYTAPEAIEETRKFILKEYGEKYLPKEPIHYTKKAKNAQEAHEAIRPTNPSFTPKSAGKYLSKDELALYDLIWKRLIASQMESVLLDQVAITIKTKAEYGLLKATGSVINFDGFYILYNEGKDEDENDEDNDKKLPKVEEGEQLKLLEVIPNQHFTEPQPRYSEASLVKKMEELGIGRPSTYASILSVIQERGYVKLDKKRFLPEPRGRIVTEFLKKYFTKYVQYDYTAKLEDDLDKIADGEEKWTAFLHEFWSPFKASIDKAMKVNAEDVLDNLNRELSQIIFGKDEKGQLQDKCPECGSQLHIKIGKFGVFVGCSKYPECKYTKNIHTEENAESGEEETAKYEVFEPKLLGNNDDGKGIFLKKGPYGFYVEVAEDDKKAKPKRVGLPRNLDPKRMDLKKALSLLSLPRVVGNHPTEGGEIKVGIGRFGPFIVYNKKFYSLGKEDDVLDVSLTRVLEIMRDHDSKPKKPGRKFVKKSTDKKSSGKSGKSVKTKKSK